MEAAYAGALERAKLRVVRAKGKAPRSDPIRRSEGLVARLALGSTTATWGQDSRSGLKGGKAKPLPRWPGLGRAGRQPGSERIDVVSRFSARSAPRWAGFSRPML